MTHGEYITKIATEWHTHAVAADKLASECGDLYEESYHAFMANAISSAMYRSKHSTEFRQATQALERAQ